MTALFAYLDGLPLGPLALFAVGWLAFLLSTLAWIRSRRVNRCDDCGGEWETTRSGNAFHVCSPPGRRRAA